ncbi:MAG: RNA polymerase sigma factor [Pseudobdellovibrionaceae bacterium]
MDSSNNVTASIEAQVFVHAEKPWLNEKGHELSDYDLKEVSKNWDQETWERYLQYLDGTLSEQQIRPYDYDDMAEKMDFTCWTFSQSDADDDIKKFVGAILKTLTRQQQRILKMTFWEGRSERFIADELRISRSTVKTLKKRVLKRLAKELKGVSPVSPLVRGKVLPLVKEGGTDEQNDYAEGLKPFAYAKC